MSKLLDILTRAATWMSMRPMRPHAVEQATNPLERSFLILATCPIPSTCRITSDSSSPWLLSRHTAGIPLSATNTNPEGRSRVRHVSRTACSVSPTGLLVADVPRAHDLLPVHDAGAPPAVPGLALAQQLGPEHGAGGGVEGGHGGGHAVVEQAAVLPPPEADVEHSVRALAADTERCAVSGTGNWELVTWMME